MYGLTITIISFLIFISYIVAAIVVFKTVPKSLSETYYMYQNKKKGLEWLFPSLILIMVATLMPSWIELSEGSNWQFLSFLCPASLLFVGAAPAFRSCDIESKVHTYSATLAAIFGLLWIILFIPYGMWIILGSVLVILALSLSTKTLKSSFTFWLEMVAFLSVYIGIIASYAVRI